MPAPAPLQKQLARFMRWAALFSLAFALVALILLARGDAGERAYRFIAAALGVGLGVLLCVGIMTLLLIGNRYGWGGSAAEFIKKEDNDPRS